MPKDLVCGREVNAQGALKTRIGQDNYFFCSKVCQFLFEANPSTYLKGNALPTPNVR